MINTRQRETWGSHIPINMSLIEVLGITGVIELGAGYHSTAAFFKSCDNVISIETDEKWVKEIQSNISQSDTKRILHYQMPDGISRKTRRHETSDDVRQEYLQFIQSNKTDTFNMLFVDSISSLRYDAVVQLHTTFDVVTFHDYQARGQKNHYCGGIKHSDDYTLYVDKTYEAHTGILLKKEFEHLIDDLKLVHSARAKAYVPNCIPNIVRM